MTETRRTDDRGHRGLGRGLSALIGDEASVSAHAPDNTGRNLRTLPVAFLRANPFQPRKHFDQKELDELASSIREKGLLQPILVRPVAGSPDTFEIVAGERRWRAAQIAHLHDVPVVVRELDDGEALEIAIIENVQRSDLNAVEEGAAYRELMSRFGYTQERLSAEIGKSRSHVANALRLIRLPEPVLAMIREGKLSAGHARTLIGAANPEALARQIVKRELNVREAEHRSAVKAAKAAGTPRKDADTKALESNISNMLGLKVEILHKGSTGGELRIAYRTLEQLDDLIQRLNNRR
jgi:ParB family transcriptional regulator, chromosome partitioning protein